MRSLERPFLLVTDGSTTGAPPAPPRADGDEAQQAVLTQLELARRCAEDADTVVVDVGAFLGDFGLAAAAAGCRVYIFEVQPRQAALIQASINVNGFGERVTLVNKAVTNASNARLTFSAAGGQTAKAGGGGGTITVDSVALDDLFPAPARIFFLKIDTEGFELDVFAGAARLFQQRRVDNVVFEYTAFWTDRADQQALLPFVEAFQPRALYALDRTGPTVYGPLGPQDVRGFWKAHNDRHLQTDVYATFSDADSRKVRATPYTQSVNA
ncbi:hypothetical protein HT031_006230 [Scenedesmus sp. PABB004]|nr:hypothetical protein HT031_006230 [Scenedesmus sp. PABB004]